MARKRRVLTAAEARGLWKVLLDALPGSKATAITQPALYERIGWHLRRGHIPARAVEEQRGLLRPPGSAGAENGVLHFTNPCPYCGVRGTLYYRRLSGTWRCQQCKLPFTDSWVTRGEFREVHDLVLQVKQAFKRAADTIDLDNFPGAAEELRTLEAWSQQAREIIARQARALAEERAGP